MHRVHMAVNIAVYRVVGDLIGKRVVLHKNMAGKIFSLHMKAGRDGDIILLAQLDRRRAQHERHHHMNDVAVLDNGLKHPFVRARKRNAVFAYIIVKRTQAEGRHHHIAVFSSFVLVRADYSDLVSALCHGADKVHC